MPRGKILDLKRHSVTIGVGRDWIFQKDPLPEGYSLTGSAITFGNLLRQEIVKRYPTTRVSVMVLPGNPAMSVEISDNHPKSKALFTDVARLSTDIAQRHRDKFLIKIGSDEEKALIAMYEPAPTKKVRSLSRRGHDKYVRQKQERMH